MVPGYGPLPPVKGSGVWALKLYRVDKGYIRPIPRGLARREAMSQRPGISSGAPATLVALTRSQRAVVEIPQGPVHVLRSS